MVSWLVGLPPEAQATLIVGFVTVIVQPIFIIATFFLGKAQGKAHIRHEKAAEVIVNCVRLISDLRVEFELWAVHTELSDLSREQAKEITRLGGELQNLVYGNSLWFDPETESKMTPVAGEVYKRTSEHWNALKSGDKARIEESGKQLSEWNTRDLTKMQVALQDEARRLIGSKRPWSRTWWGKPLAWFARKTRFFVA